MWLLPLHFKAPELPGTSVSMPCIHCLEERTRSTMLQLVLLSANPGEVIAWLPNNWGEGRAVLWNACLLRKKHLSLEPPICSFSRKGRRSESICVCKVTDQSNQHHLRSKFTVIKMYCLSVPSSSLSFLNSWSRHRTEIEEILHRIKRINESSLESLFFGLFFFFSLRCWKIVVTARHWKTKFCSRDFQKMNRRRLNMFSAS